MAATNTVLKIVVLMFVAWFKTTQCQTMQSQDYVLRWNIIESDSRNPPVFFDFTAHSFSRFYSCLCKNDTKGCSAGTAEEDFEREEWESDKADTSGKIYLCVRQFDSVNSEYWTIYCVKLRADQNAILKTLNCSSYISHMAFDNCQVDKVDIVWDSIYTTEVIYINESVVQVTNCQEDIVHTTAPKSSETSTTPMPTPLSQLTTYRPNHATSTNAVQNPSSSNMVKTSMTSKHPTNTDPTDLPSSILPSVITGEASTVLTIITSVSDTSLTKKEDENDNLVTIILGVALGVVVIIATVIIIVVVFWRRRRSKGNPTSAQSRNNRCTRTGDYESPYEMSDVRDNSTENSNSQTPVSVPGPSSYLYATVDLEKKHRNRKRKNTKKKSKGDHVYNNEKAFTTFGKNRQAKSGNASSHVGDYYNLDSQQNDTETPKGSATADNDKATVGSSEVNIDDNADDYNVVDITSTSADANATNSNDASSNSNNNNNDNNTDDEKNRLGNVDQSQDTNLQTIENRVKEQNSIVNDGQSQDTGTEYSRLHETQRHFHNPYNILPDQVPVSTTTSAAQPTTKAPVSSSFDIAAGTSTYSLATPISK